MRQIVLDTETTGLEPEQGHRIIEIGCVELIDRRLTGNTWHKYINPQRDIDEAAIEVHGITLQKLQDEPLFAEIAEEFVDFIRGVELIIHNAPFDVGFMDSEFRQCEPALGVTTDYAGVLDTLSLARKKHPGQKNNLDALCRRYEVDNTQRTLHGALLDAEILADVYLRMTGGQMTLLGQSEEITRSQQDKGRQAAKKSQGKTPFITASEEELAQHQCWIELLDQQPDSRAIWHSLDEQ